MKSARFLVVALLPLLAACVTSAPTYVWQSSPEASAIPKASTNPEKNCPLSGYVLDATTCQPLPNVTVLLSGWRLFKTDARGYFTLTLPSFVRKQPAELVVQSVLYEGSAPLPTDTASRVILLAKRKRFRTLAGECQQLADSVHVSPSAEPLFGLPGTQMAFLILDSAARQPRKLRTFTFRGGENGFPCEPFRVRIYRYDGPEQPPGEDLLTENCVINNVRDGVISTDLSSYQIQPHAVGNVFLPTKGFFVAFEWIVTEWRGIVAPMDAYVPVGPVLRPPCAFIDARTWVYVIGKGWHRATAVENCWPLYESALSVEVEPAPSQPTKH